MNKMEWIFRENSRVIAIYAYTHTNMKKARPTSKCHGGGTIAQIAKSKKKQKQKEKTIVVCYVAVDQSEFHAAPIHCQQLLELACEHQN